MADVSPSTLADELTALPDDDTLIEFLLDDTNAGENKTKKLKQSFLKTLMGAHTITPQMYGAVGDGVTDDSAAVQAAADACDALNSPTIVRPVFHFPHAAGYRCVSTITIKEFIHVQMDAPLIHDGTQSSAGMVIGTTNIVNGSIKLKLRVDRASVSNWTNEGSIGIKLINLEGSDANITLPSGGFTIGLQCMGSDTGFSNNTIRLGRLINNKIGLDITNESNGFTNENVFIAGRFSLGSAIMDGVDRWGVRLTSADGTNKSVNSNVFIKPNFELFEEGVPVLVEHGQRNQFWNCRSESNSSVFAQINHDADLRNTDNHFDFTHTDGDIVQIGNAADNTKRYRGDATSYAPLRPVFDSGPLHTNAVAYDGTQTHIPNVHTAQTSLAASTIAKSAIAFSVSETCTFDDTDNEVDHTSHTRVNGDIVFFTTDGTLPVGVRPGVAAFFYVVNSIADHFQVSTTKNGSPVTDYSGGSGTHEYHSRNRYLDIGGSRAVGVFVDTSTAKHFLIDRDTDTVAGNRGGRLLIQCFDADGVQLQNQEEFTVDDADDELVQADHTLIVGDRITLTTTGTLPGTLATSTDYWVVSVDVSEAGRFQVSLTEGGSAVTDLSGGSGLHTYHLSYHYAVMSSGGFWISDFGGSYKESSDNENERPFHVRDEVQSINLLLSGGSNPIHLRRFQLYNLDRPANSPRTWKAYDSQPGQVLVSQAPTFGVYFSPMIVWDDTPASAAPPGWVLTASGAPGTWVAMANLA